jgi:hypothetical protein
MSVYQNQTSATPGNSFFVENGNQIDFISSISVYNGAILTSQINLDAIQMDCAYLGPTSTATLLLNGLPVASVSSFTSSITTWSSYPALTPITYAAGGGTANLATVNALSNISTASAVAGSVNTNSISSGTIAVSSINGTSFPSPLTAVVNVTGSVIVSGRNTTVIDFGSVASGYYLLTVYVSSGGLDPFTCSSVVRVSGGLVTGGGFHCPSLGGNPPTFSNCVSIQDNGAGSSQLTVIIYCNDASGLGAVPQLAAYRLT